MTCALHPPFTLVGTLGGPGFAVDSRIDREESRKMEQSTRSEMQDASLGQFRLVNLCQMIKRIFGQNGDASEKAFYEPGTAHGL